jgi:predicted secreted protein
MHRALGEQGEHRQANVASAAASSASRRVIVMTLVMSAKVIATFVTSTGARPNDVSPACICDPTPPLGRLINISVSHTVSFR